MGLTALTLLIVSALIFALAEVLPGDVGRTILGPLASDRQVQALEAELGADRPLPVRYADWLAGFATGDWGESPVLQTEVQPLVLERLASSAQLGAVALLLVVPFSVAAGVLSGLREGGWFDRSTTIVGLSLTAIPEFVSGALLLVVFAVQLDWFPVSAEFPPGATLLDRLYHLFLPAVPLMFVLFGYIARMARAGTIDVLASPYVRTATLKGLPRRRVVLRHVLPNAMIPTITVIGVQVGWLVGGLVVVETLFSYPGIGQLMLSSATSHDVPTLEAAALLVAVIYMVSNLAVDLLTMLLNPRARAVA